jgi:hypothetical protein
MSARVAELTVDELKQIIEEAMEQKLEEMLGGPDEGLELREEITVRLRRSLGLSSNCCRVRRDAKPPSRNTFHETCLKEHVCH